MAVQQVAFHIHPHLTQCALPGEDVGVNGVYQRAIQVEDQCVHDDSLPRQRGGVPQPDYRLVAAVVSKTEFSRAAWATEETPTRCRGQAESSCLRGPAKTGIGPLDLEVLSPFWQDL